METILTQLNIESEAICCEKPVLIDFWATWCGPCQMIAPIIKEIADEMTEIKVCKVNVDEQRAIASKFAIDSIPTLVLLKDGKEVRRLVGYRPKSSIIEAIKANIE